MADYSGRKIKYGLAKEATRGTWVTPTYWLRWESADFYNHATTIFNQSSIGVLDHYSGSAVVQSWANGGLSGKVTDRGIGLILLSTLGGYSVATAPSETIVFNHTFTESQSNQPQSLAITRVQPNDQTNYANAVVGSFELEAKAGDYVRHTTNLTSFLGTTSSGATPAFVAENEFKSKHVTTKLAANIAGLAGATAIPTAGVKISINKNLMPYYIVGQDGPADIYAQNVEVTGEFTLRYTTEAYNTLRFNNTQQAMSITIANTDVTIGVSKNPTLVFTMPAVVLNDFAPDQSIDGIVTQTISFTALYDLTSAYAIQAVLTNLVATY